MLLLIIKKKQKNIQEKSTSRINSIGTKQARGVGHVVFCESHIKTNKHARFIEGYELSCHHSVGRLALQID